MQWYLTARPRWAVYINSIPRLDINECTEGTDSCVQNCTNIEGSYLCNCSSGYRLGSDGYSCIGMAAAVYLVICLIPLFQIPMSVKRILMDVHRTVEIRQGHSGVAVIQAISWAMTVGLAKVIELNLVTP